VNTAIETGRVIHDGRYCRVVYHEGRQQPAAFWVQENDMWIVERFYGDWGDALAHAVRFEGGAG